MGDMTRTDGCLFAATSAALVLAACAAPGPEDLTFVQAGTVPIILTAPHGGSEAVPGVREEIAQAADRDVKTSQLVREVMDRVEGLVGGKPYVVIARFHRRDIDANRPEDRAFKDPDARPYYRAYHNAIRGFVDEARREYPRGAVLIDIHGQNKDGYRSVVCRGTRNVRTVTALIQRHGMAALTGPNSILGHLEASGYEVFPPNDPTGRVIEEPCYNGGYTVVTYGSHNDDGVDAVQLEIGWYLRRDEARSRFAGALAEAIAAFHGEYLAPEPPLARAGVTDDANASADGLAGQ